MTGAELQTLREAAGLSREALAELVDVEARTVKHWENGRAGVPADVALVAQAAAQWVRVTAEKMKLEIDIWTGKLKPMQINRITARGQRTITTKPRPPVVLLRYRDTAHMHPGQRAQGQRADVHGAMVARVAQDLAAEGVRARVVWFDPDAYAAWVDAQRLADTPELHAHWAQGQALAAQAIPPRGDQPPPGFAPGYGTPSTGTTRGRSRP